MDSLIYYSKSKDRRSFVEQILEKFAGQINKAGTILVKPNLVSADPYPTTTHPQMLAAVLACLKGKKIVVADGPAADAGNSDLILEKSPLKNVCNKYQVPLLNLYRTGIKFIFSKRGFPLRVSKLPLEVDYTISLPVLKAHSCCNITGALKNQFGYLPRQDRFAWHGFSRLSSHTLHRGIAEINVVAKPDLFIVDAVETLVGCQEKRHGGRERDLGYILAGTDPVALDCYGLKLMQKVDSGLAGLSCSDVLHIKYSGEFGVGVFDYKIKSL